MPDILATVRRRDSSRSRPRAHADETLRGFLRALPQVGTPLILYVPRPDGGLDRLVTSIVQRVLMDANGRDLFVSTRRSSYAVTLDEPAETLPPPLRTRVSFDGVEVTQHPASPDAAAEDDTGSAE